MTTQKKNKKTQNNAEFRTSLNNYILNILIFLLTTIIIYLIYSIFIKLNSNDISREIVQKSDKHDEIIQVEVLNGCGVSGIADRFTDYLREHNVDVVKTGNYIKFDVNETIVIDRVGKRVNADFVAELLGVTGTNAFTQINNDYFVDVTVIIGRDYFKQSPIKKE